MYIFGLHLEGWDASLPSLKFILKENQQTLQQITRQEKDYLITKNLLRMVNGKHPDLSITSKKKKGKRKKYYVIDCLAERAKNCMREIK